MQRENKTQEIQFKYVDNKTYLENILDTQKASEELGISQGYLRNLILKGEFQEWEYRKFGKTIVLLKESVEQRKGKFKSYNKK